jgi:hypothetical protein
MESMIIRYKPLFKEVIFVSSRKTNVSDHRVSPERQYSPKTSGLRVLQVAVSGTAMRTSVHELDRSPQDAVPCDRLPFYPFLYGPLCRS